jgi:hypothetical protein
MYLISWISNPTPPVSLFCSSYWHNKIPTKQNNGRTILPPARWSTPHRRRTAARTPLPGTKRVSTLKCAGKSRGSPKPSLATTHLCSSRPFFCTAQAKRRPHTIRPILSTTSNSCIASLDAWYWRWKEKSSKRSCKCSANAWWKSRPPSFSRCRARSRVSLGWIDSARRLRLLWLKSLSSSVTAQPAVDDVISRHFASRHCPGHDPLFVRIWGRGNADYAGIPSLATNYDALIARLSFQKTVTIMFDMDLKKTVWVVLCVTILRSSHRFIEGSY